MGNATKKTAEKLATDAGMQFDSRYMHWIAPRGKFEGEQWYAPYFYDVWAHGDGENLYADDHDECDAMGTLFDCTADECETFDIAPGSWVLLREDSQGFVMVTVHADRAAAEAKYRNWIGE